jgi:hypothetical protein
MTYSSEGNNSSSFAGGQNVNAPRYVPPSETAKPAPQVRLEQKSTRESGAYEMSELFLGEMKARAELRNGLEQKQKATRQREQEILKRQADEYRERLRKYLRPELREDG